MVVLLEAGPISTRVEKCRTIQLDLISDDTSQAYNALSNDQEPFGGSIWLDYVAPSCLFWRVEGSCIFLHESSFSGQRVDYQLLIKFDKFRISKDSVFVRQLKNDLYVLLVTNRTVHRLKFPMTAIERKAAGFEANADGMNIRRESFLSVATARNLHNAGSCYYLESITRQFPNVTCSSSYLIDDGNAWFAIGTDDASLYLINLPSVDHANQCRTDVAYFQLSSSTMMQRLFSGYLMSQLRLKDRNEWIQRNSVIADTFFQLDTKDLFVISLHKDFKMRIWNCSNQQMLATFVLHDTLLADSGLSGDNRELVYGRLIGLRIGNALRVAVYTEVDNVCLLRTFDIYHGSQPSDDAFYLQSVHSAPVRRLCDYKMHALSFDSNGHLIIVAWRQQRDDNIQMELFDIAKGALLSTGVVQKYQLYADCFIGDVFSELAVTSGTAVGDIAVCYLQFIFEMDLFDRNSIIAALGHYLNKNHQKRSDGFDELAIAINGKNVTDLTIAELRTAVGSLLLAQLNAALVSDSRLDRSKATLLPDATNQLSSLDAHVELTAEELLARQRHVCNRFFERLLSYQLQNSLTLSFFSGGVSSSKCAYADSLPQWPLLAVCQTNVNAIFLSHCAVDAICSSLIHGADELVLDSLLPLAPDQTFKGTSSLKRIFLQCASNVTRLITEADLLLFMWYNSCYCAGQLDVIERFLFLFDGAVERRLANKELIDDLLEHLANNDADSLNADYYLQVVLLVERLLDMFALHEPDSTQAHDASNSVVSDRTLYLSMLCSGVRQVSLMRCHCLLSLHFLLHLFQEKVLSANVKQKLTSSVQRLRSILYNYVFLFGLATHRIRPNTILSLPCFDFFLQAPSVRRDQDYFTDPYPALFYLASDAGLLQKDSLGDNETNLFSADSIEQYIMHILQTFNGANCSNLLTVLYKLFRRGQVPFVRELLNRIPSTGLKQCGDTYQFLLALCEAMFDQSTKSVSAFNAVFDQLSADSHMVRVIIPAMVDSVAPSDVAAILPSGLQLVIESIRLLSYVSRTVLAAGCSDLSASPHVVLHLANKGMSFAAEAHRLESLSSLCCIAFTNCLALGAYSSAFQTIVTNPQRESQRDCLQRMIMELCKLKRFGVIVNDIDWGYFMPDVIALVEKLARTTDMQAGSLYHLAFSLRSVNDRYLLAAEPMLEYFERILLETNWQSTDRKHLSDRLEAAVSAVTVSMNCLEVQPNDNERFIVWTAREPKPEPDVDVRHVVTLPQLRTRCTIGKCLLSLVAHSDKPLHADIRHMLAAGLLGFDKDLAAKARAPPSAATSSALTAGLTALLGALAQCARFAEASQLIDDTALDASLLFEHLAQCCIHSGQHSASFAFADLSRTDVHIKQAPVEHLWRQLSDLLSHHDEQHQSKYHRLVLGVFVQCAQAPPSWFLESYERRNAAELIRELAASGLVGEAMELSSRYVEAASAVGAFGHAATLSTQRAAELLVPVWLPYNLFDSLLQLDDAHRHAAARAKLQKALDNHLQRVAQVDAIYRRVQSTRTSHF